MRTNRSGWSWMEWQTGFLFVLVMLWSLRSVMRAQPGRPEVGPLGESLTSAAGPLATVAAGAAPAVPLSGASFRDPFKPILAPPSAGSAAWKLAGPLPPGPRGLLIGDLRLEGIVREEATQTMIAVVANHTNLAYFLRENQAVYDGQLTRITPDAVYFRQNLEGPNPQGGSREVVMRLAPQPAEAR